MPNELTGSAATEILRTALVQHVGEEQPDAAFICYADPIVGYHGTVVSDTEADSSAGWDPDEDSVITGTYRFADLVAAIHPISDVHVQFYVYPDATITWHRPRPAAHPPT